jgi:hypothetical protein
MESKRESPKQMLRRAIGAPQKSEVSEQQQPMLASPARIQKGSTSPLLSHVKRTQADAQANRTSERVEVDAGWNTFVRKEARIRGGCHSK